MAGFRKLCVPAGSLLACSNLFFGPFCPASPSSRATYVSSYNVLFAYLIIVLKIHGHSYARSHFSEKFAKSVILAVMLLTMLRILKLMLIVDYC